jgi:hypothetical protein
MGAAGMSRGTYALPCLTYLKVEDSVRPFRDAACLCRRIPGAAGCAALTMEPSGLQSSTSFWPPECSQAPTLPGRFAAWA